MTLSTRQILAVVGGGLVAGVLADLLLREIPWGVNIAIWTGAFLIIGAVTLLRSRVRLHGRCFWLLLPILFFAGAFAWRASPTLAILNGLGLFLSIALAVMRPLSGRFHLAGTVEYTVGIIRIWLQTVVGFSNLLTRDLQWQQIPKGSLLGNGQAIARGLFLALPLLILFGGLLVAADASFERIIDDLLRWDFTEILIHGAWISLFTAIAGGLLRKLLIEEDSSASQAEHNSALTIGIVETIVILGALNLLFLSFILAQFSYFFGGTDLGAAAHGLSQAEYARRGFFELVTVALLVLPLLLILHWLLLRKKPSDEQIFRALAGGLVLLLFVIMASALHRMYLYQSAFGLTELRLYTTAFMVWLAVVFIWFMATVLDGKRERFAFGALGSALVWIVLLNILNPDASIARLNLARAAAGESFDPLYVTSLSADAIPALLEGLPALHEEDRRFAAATIIARWSPAAPRDWRSWNWGMSQATESVTHNVTALKGMAAQPAAQLVDSIQLKSH